MRHLAESMEKADYLDAPVLVVLPSYRIAKSNGSNPACEFITEDFLSDPFRIALFCLL
jgi:hypothetical protein